MSFAFISQPFGELSNTVLPAAASEARGEISGHCCFYSTVVFGYTHSLAPLPPDYNQGFLCSILQGL